MRKKLFVFLIIFIIIVIFLVFCFQNLDSKTNQDYNQIKSILAQEVVSSVLTHSESENNEEDRYKRFESWFSKLTIEDLDEIKTVITSDEISNIQENDEFIILLNSIPEEHVYLYGCSQGVILRINEYFQFFEWFYLTGRGILPVMDYADYDCDGRKEIAISFLIGTGTGVSVDYLYLIEVNNAGMMQAFEFTSEQYVAQLEESITANYDNQNSMLQFYINGKSVGKSIDITKIFDENVDYREIRFGQQIGFSFSNDEIIMSVTPELYLGNMGAAFYEWMPNISAKVMFNNGTFSLSDFKYEDAVQ